MSQSAPRRRIERAMALSNGKPLEQVPGTRSCVHPGCTTRLSRYNPHAHCAAHGGWADAERRRQRSGS